MIRLSLRVHEGKRLVHESSEHVHDTLVICSQIRRKKRDRWDLRPEGLSVRDWSSARCPRHCGVINSASCCLYHDYNYITSCTSPQASREQTTTIKITAGTTGHVRSPQGAGAASDIAGSQEEDSSEWREQGVPQIIARFRDTITGSKRPRDITVGSRTQTGSGQASGRRRKLRTVSGNTSDDHR